MWGDSLVVSTRMGCVTIVVNDIHTMYLKRTGEGLKFVRMIMSRKSRS